MIFALPSSRRWELATSTGEYAMSLVPLFAPFRSRPLWAACAAAAALAAMPASAQTFLDQTFNLADYNIFGPVTSGVSVDIENCAACGVGASLALSIAATYPTDVGAFRVALVNTGWGYDPSSQGALWSVTAQTDKNVLLNFSTGNGLGNSFRPLMVQGGVYYAALLLGPVVHDGSEGWQGIGPGVLLAADFSAYDLVTGSFSADHPDFSAGPMGFGLLQLSSRNGPLTNSQVTAQYDNLSLTLQPVPEPATWLMFAVGAALLASWRGRRPGQTVAGRG